MLNLGYRVTSYSSGFSAEVCTDGSESGWLHHLWVCMVEMRILFSPQKTPILLIAFYKTNTISFLFRKSRHGGLSVF